MEKSGVWCRVDGRIEQRRKARKAVKRGNKCARKTSEMQERVEKVQRREGWSREG